MRTSNTLIDDRLLVAALIGEHITLPKSELWTTSTWYYRASRAAIAGGSGQLSGPFEDLPAATQAVAMQSMLALPDSIRFLDARILVPAMAAMHLRHPRLNLINLEALSAAALLPATVALGPGSAAGILPAVFEAESITWKLVTPV